MVKKGIGSLPYKCPGSRKAVLGCMHVSRSAIHIPVCIFGVQSCACAKRKKSWGRCGERGEFAKIEREGGRVGNDIVGPAPGCSETELRTWLGSAITLTRIDTSL